LVCLAAPVPARAQGTPVPPAAGRVTPPGIVLPDSVQDQAPRPVRHLSIDEAVELALEHNLNVQVARIDPQIQDTAIAVARSAWVPNLSTTFAGDNRNTPAASFLAGGDTKVVDKQFSNLISVDQQLPWGGGRYSAAWDSSRNSTSNIFTSFDPILRSQLRLSYTQPLLRDFAIDGSRQQLFVTLNGRELSDVQMRRTVASTVREVRHAYWDLVFAISSLDVQRQSLELAEQSLRNTRTRAEVGTMAPIDIVEAEAEVARNEEAVILAEAEIERAEDRLRALILDPGAPDFWTLRFEPTDTPLLQARAIDIDAAVQTALAQRTDAGELRKSLETTDVNVRYFRNQTLPSFDLQVDYAVTGLGGTRMLFDQRGGFPPPVIGQEERGFGSVLSDIVENAFPTWTVGFTVGYPIGRSNAEANLARARLERRQSETRLRNLDLQITSQVRDVGRQVNTNLKRVEATRAAREFAERRLEAEGKKFGVGMSTNYLVFQAQRDLAAARNNELRAVLDYIRSLVDFEAVQEIPIGTGSAIAGVGSVNTSGVTPVAGGSTSQASGGAATGTGGGFGPVGPR